MKDRNITPPRSVAERIRAARLANRLTQAELGDLANVDKMIVSRFETGKGVRLSNFEKLMSTLDELDLMHRPEAEVEVKPEPEPEPTPAPPTTLAMTMTWKAAMAAYIHIIETGQPESKALVKQELMNLAENLDQLKEATQ